MKSKEILTIKNEKIKSLSKNQFIKKNEIDIHNGLSSNEAKLRNNKYGLNVINKKDNNLFLLKIILNQFKDLMNVMIIGIIIFNVVSITYLPSDSIIDFATQTSVLSIILFLNIFLSIFYEIRAKRALDSIEKNIPILAKVLRDGKIVNINVSEITIGDIVYLDEGTIVPADLMLIESNSLKIEEAALTGEAIPSEKDSEKEINENVALGDKINCAFSSTVVTYGSGIGIVTAIGKDTEIGKIANLISASSESKKISLLKKKVNTLITNLTIISFTSLILCIVLNTILFLTQYSSSGGDYHFWLSVDTIINLIALTIAILPIALPITNLICLLSSMVQLSKKNIICKFPEIMDTVGDLSIICTDKTGTLTTNLMTVVAVADYNDICEKKNKEIEEIRKDLNRYKHLISIGMFCNNAEINTLDSKCIGDPTEGALLHLGEKTELSIEKTRNKYKRVFEQPFDSNRKMMTTVYQTKKGYTSFTKGAAESILNFCDHIQTNNGIRKITDKDKKIIIDYLENMSSQALRVLGLASTNFTKIPNKNSNYEYSMTFKGLVGMIDPPKKNASKTINILKNAGISVAMITGDHPITALAIARNIGITNKDDSNILTNTEIDAISDKQLEAIIPNTHVFARISPENKLRIVKAFKKDNIVAMIGDGTNDAPSLKEADAGIAMAGIGTDVAKDAASILLLDDKFETLSTVINEGRKISRNIKNVVSFILSTNIATWLLVLLTTYIFSINVLNISQRLLLDLATDMLPCIYIGLNGNNLDLMKKRNKKNNDHTSFFNKSLVYITIVNTLFILISILTVFFILWFGLRLDYDNPDHSNVKIIDTACFVALAIARIVTSLTYIDSKRSIFSHEIFGKIGNNIFHSCIFSIIILALVVFIPGINIISLTPPLSDLFNAICWQIWILLILIAISPMLIIEIFKFIKSLIWRKNNI